MTRTSSDPFTERARDALYVSVGLGVLAVQRAQIQRRELEERIGEYVKDARDQGRRAEDLVTGQLRALDERLRELEERVEHALDDAEERLPDGVAEALAQVRRASRDTRARSER